MGGGVADRADRAAAGPGRVVRVAGPLVELDGLAHVGMSELVALGPNGLSAEVVAIRGTRVTAQVYEYTGGLAPGDAARSLGRPLSAPLGPHLLGGVFDGLLRPLGNAPRRLSAGVPPRSVETSWSWRPERDEGSDVAPGAVLGTLTGRGGLACRVLVPANRSGRVDRVAPAGRVPAEAVLARVGGEPVRATTHWPVRRPRPARERLDADEPFLTGQRILDAVYPLARGSTAAVPGGFGTGKTVLLQQIAKWCTADVIVYVGCGERGNEMADVLGEFAALSDPRTGRPLSERTVIIANTSNMPIMAREASIHSGITVAEYFRDMGYHAVVIADSTSRWAEALREAAARAGALPAEEGYPATLPSALAAFYERAGHVTTLGGSDGSVTIIGAVSPPGGDTTEPVTAHSRRIARVLWNLDRDLAYARHYPSVAWNGSFSLDAEKLALGYARGGDPDWPRRRARIVGLLAQADRLAALAELVGAGSLPDHERVALLAGRLVRESVLQQNAQSENDNHCSAPKTAALADGVLRVVDRCQELVSAGTDIGAVERFDYSPLLRAAGEYGPDDAQGVTDRVSALLVALADAR